jgi:hypothetical protein
MATRAEMLRNKADKLINLPTNAQRFITNPQAFTQLLTGKNPLPRETGFAAGATGLSPTDTSVLDPKQMEYMKGYDQGEPFGIASMALPLAAPATVATAKALAPKAGQMAENYMIKQGFMPSIVAYHGTPHTIQGKFDINKVGTGEGAQAYGHGMYFAEAPDVAKSYATDRSYVGKFMAGKPDTTPWEANRIAQDTLNVYGDNAVAQLEKTLKNNSFSKNPQQIEANKQVQDAIDLLKTNQLTSKGNLYKVDIPDAYIPTMMDYDKPLGQQSDIVKKALNDLKKQITPEMKMELGGDMNLLFGKDVTPVQLLNTLEIIHPTGGVGIGEKMLNELGVKGIRYLDNASRDAGKGTSNFVIFDPSDVKILEKNNQPISRKELLEKQINDLNSGN